MAIKRTWKKGVASIEVDGWHAATLVFILITLGVIAGSFFA